MEKWIIKRKPLERQVLYEPNEPLFATQLKRRPYLLRAAVSLILAVVFIALVWWVTDLALRGDLFNDFFGGGSSGGKVPFGSESGGDSMAESEHNSQYDEQPSETNGNMMENPDENETYASDDSSMDHTEATTESSSEISIVELDLSESEKGEKYIINYTDKKVDVEGMLDSGFVYSEIRGGQAPIVMIIHTHTSEEYTYDPENNFKGIDSVVSVGDKINSRLNSLGIPSIHCSVIHDADPNVNAYKNARETIEMLLDIYPSIKYVIDVHRMYLEDEDGRLIKTVSKDGEAAQIKITASADGQSGQNWSDNLSLALALRHRLNVDASHVCTPVVLSSGRYNSDMSRFYLMIDVGSVGNYTHEAMAAGERFADALADIIAD